MADSTSARFGAPLYSADGTDIVDFANQVNAIVEAFDAQAALLSQAFPPGGIMLSAAQTVPTGWLRCDGSAVSRTTYSALFSAISTAFGAGDGSTTFNLPDYRGRVPIGSGAGAGLTTRTVGAKGGEETHALFGSEGTLLPQSTSLITLSRPRRTSGLRQYRRGWPEPALISSSATATLVSA